VADENDDVKSILFCQTESEYENLNVDHLVEAYKFFSGTADNVSMRRQSANNFYLTLNTALLALIGYSIRYSANDNHLSWLPIVLIAVFVGCVLSYLWYQTIKSHEQLNRGKFEIINLMEEALRFAPYKAEWKVLGEGKDSTKYKKTTGIEKTLPKVFAGLYGLCGVSYVVMWLNAICKCCE